MSLLIAAGTAIFFVFLFLLVELRAKKRDEQARVSRDERRNMKIDEDFQFFAETDTEDQEEK